MTEELIVNNEAFNGDQEDYDSIREAIKRLSSASQDQFDSMKKEKWYNRVFDMVTLSQKGKRRVAEQVSTLSQAQQIFIELLLRLSENDASISKIVMDSMDDIKRIQEQNIYLLERINRLEDAALGIRTDMDLSKLSDSEKKVLCACLYYLGNKTEQVSEQQKKYANSVIKYLNVDAQMENPLAGVDEMPTESKRRILTSCMEFIFLNDCTDKNYSKYEEFISEFDFGHKSMDVIERQIMSLYNLRGADGFYNKYQEGSSEQVSDVFTVVFDTEDEEETGYVPEMQDEYISSIMQIRPDETRIYRYKNIHLSAFVNCEGELVFDHCIIYYNESDSGDEITLASGAKLRIADSVVLCKGLDVNAFITGENKSKVQIENTTFEDCSYFVKSNGTMSEFVMTNCELHNCISRFVSIDVGKLYEKEEEGECTISNNAIIMDSTKEFNKELRKRYPEFERHSIIRAPETLFEVRFSGKKIGHFSNNIVKEYASFRRPDMKNGRINIEMEILSSANVEVKNCLFKELSNGGHLKANWFSECKFENCNGAIQTNSFHTDFQSSNGCSVDNCVFVNCQNVIKAAKNTSITNCQFVSCNDSIISCEPGAGGVSVEYCEFINTQSSLDDDACLMFEGSKSSDSKSNQVKKCIFNGVQLRDAFLIAAETYEKLYDTVAYIEGCDFKNCSTCRTDGKIIKEYVKYDTLFKKNRVFRAISISGCRGMDKTNKEGSKIKNVKVRTVSTTGNIIGSTRTANSDLTTVASAVGAPASLLILAGIEKKL